MLRPIDIQNKEFEKKLKGYNCDEVDDFLDVVIQDYELCVKKIRRLKIKSDFDRNCGALQANGKHNAEVD